MWIMLSSAVLVCDIAKRDYDDCLPCEDVGVLHLLEDNFRKQLMNIIATIYLAICFVSGFDEMIVYNYVYG